MATLWHGMMAVSLDGRIARAGHGLDWLDPFPPEAFGYDAFYAGVDAILMGRATYEVVRGMGDWPYPGKPVTVATRRTLPDAPASVTAAGGDMAGIVAAMAARGHARVWVMGGGEVVRQALAVGALDLLELAVIPVVLGEGPTLFPDGTPEAAFELLSCTPKPGGALHLHYRRRGSAAAREHDPV